PGLYGPMYGVAAAPGSCSVWVCRRRVCGYQVADLKELNMPANVLWIIAVVVAIIGVIVLVSGSVLWGIILLILAALIGPGGYSVLHGRASPLPPRGPGTGAVRQGDPRADRRRAHDQLGRKHDLSVEMLFGAVALGQQ